MHWHRLNNRVKSRGLYKCFEFHLDGPRGDLLVIVRKVNSEYRLLVIGSHKELYTYHKFDKMVKEDRKSTLS